MSADTAAVLIVLTAAPAATVFPVLYALTTKWWRTWIGRALMVSSTSLGLLIDISLIYNWLGDDYAVRDVVRLTVFSLISLGVWLKLIALLIEKVPVFIAWRKRRH